jgi:presenilin 1
MGRHRPKTAAETSALDAVGEEIVAIVAPVSICMMCCAFLVRLLRAEGEDATAEMQGGIASAAYQENADDSIATKAGGAVLNSLVFVAFITCATFGIFFLFKHNCTKVIWAYMGFSGLLIFGMLGSIVGMEVLQALDIPIDLLTFFFCVWNFSIVGVLVVFFWPAPLLVKQTYLVNLGAVVAFYFTRIPEWTTWVLLVAMAIYDLFAVLTPGGPLRVLVELAQERNEDIPALVYEARPVRRAARPPPTNPSAGGVLEAMMAAPRTARARGLGGEGENEDKDDDRTGAGAGGSRREAGGSDGGGGGEDVVSESMPLLIGEDRGGGGGGGGVGGSEVSGDRDRDPERGGSVDEEDDGFFLPSAIKLGLGDFIFYSVLVGRAAMYDAFTMFACYLAIVQGLIATLLLLGFAQKALPALPISIALGVLTYLGSRFAFEPAAQQFLARGLMF